MLRSIRTRLLGASGTNSRRGTRHGSSPRPLRFENLECRALLANSALFNALSNGSFEAPVLAANTFQYAPTGSSWQFAGSAGVASNGSGFTASNPNAPDGNQVAFLQAGGSMSQSVYLNAGTYSISLAGRPARPAQTHNQEIEVLVDGAPGRH